VILIFKKKSYKYHSRFPSAPHIPHEGGITGILRLRMF
jgi:hypothetical protein